MKSLTLFPDYSFLLKLCESLDEIKTFLKCSIGLYDFICIFNENKESISIYLNKREALILDGLIEEKSFSKSFDQNFWIALIDIKEYQIKINKKFFKVNIYNYENNISKLRFLLFLYLIDIFTIEINDICNILLKTKIIGFNNIELILIIDALLNNNANKDFFINFIKEIVFENLDNEFILFFSKNIKWDIKFIIIIASNIKISLSNIEFILLLINEIKNMKEVNFIIEDIQIKFIEFIANLKINSNDKNKKIIQIASKLIYISDKNCLMKGFLEEISQKFNLEILNKILIISLLDYKLTEITINNIILSSIKNSNFEFCELLEKTDFYNYFLKKLELFIIRDNELFLEEDSFNLKLLYNLYIRKFFQKNYNSLYEKKTISILEYISNRIINIKDISYNELICISKKNNRIELFSLLDGIDKSIYKKIIDFLEIAEIYNDFKTIQFSSLQKLLNFIENFKTINIEMEKKKQI